MALKLLILVSLLCAFCHNNDARILARCPLARELDARSVPRNLVSSWVCIAQYGSSYNTSAVKPFLGGSFNWGVFQINDLAFCDPQDGRPSLNFCQLACRDVATDDIGNSLSCAQKMWKILGFKAWPEWHDQCGDGAKLPNVDDCF